MLKKWILSLVACLTVLTCLSGCSSGGGEAESQESVQQKAEEGKPLGRRDKARLEETQQQNAPAGEAPAGGQ